MANEIYKQRLRANIQAEDPFKPREANKLHVACDKPDCGNNVDGSCSLGEIHVGPDVSCSEYSGNQGGDGNVQAEAEEIVPEIVKGSRRLMSRKNSSRPLRGNTED